MPPRSKRKASTEVPREEVQPVPEDGHAPSRGVSKKARVSSYVVGLSLRLTTFVVCHARLCPLGPSSGSLYVHRNDAGGGVFDGSPQIFFC